MDTTHVFNTGATIKATVAFCIIAILSILFTSHGGGQTIPPQAQIEVQQTVNENVGICASTTAIAVATGKSVYYCVTLRNSGMVPLSQHTLTVASKTIAFTQTLNPGQVIQLTSNVLTSLGKDGTLLSQLINGAVGAVFTNTITITSTNSQAAVATGQAVVRVVIGSVGLKVSKTVGLTDSCATTKDIGVDVNTLVQYCVTMQNTGSLPLVHHRLVDPLLKVDVSFVLVVPQGAVLVITDGTVRKYDPTQRLEYFVTDSITNTITFTSATTEGIVAANQDSAYVTVGLNVYLPLTVTGLKKSALTKK